MKPEISGEHYDEWMTGVMKIYLKISQNEESILYDLLVKMGEC